MPERIVFDFAKAQGILAALNECNRSLIALSMRLSRIISNTGNWWQGESFDAYRQIHVGSSEGVSAIAGIAGETSLIIKHLVYIAERKREWEKIGSKIIDA